MVLAGTSIDATALSRLVGMVYDCALDPLRWEDTLAELRGALRFSNAMFTIWTAASGRPLLNVTSGIAPDYAARLSEFGPAIIEQWGGPAAIGAFEIGEPQVLSRVRSAIEWPDSSYFHEWIAPQGISDLMAVAITRERDNYCSVGFARHVSDGPIGGAEIDLVRLLAPHIRRAAAISRMLDISAVTTATFAATLDAAPTPILLVDEALEIVHANRSGHDLLSEDDGLREVRGRLVLPTPAQSQALEALLPGAGRQESGLGNPGGIALQRRAGPAVLHVLPLRYSPFRASLAPRAAAAVFVAVGPARQLSAGDALAALYGLTPAETRVLAAIATGATPAEAARQLGVGLGTTRTHLLRLFAKTSTHRQAELMRLAASLSL
jgi:DNA-binding CsgD family transcriptional regulator/PAS domain-containing protein